MSVKQRHLRRKGCSIFILMLLLLGLLVYFNDSRDYSSQNLTPPSSETFVIQISATPNPGVQIQEFSRYRIPNQGSFRILSFAETQHSESKITHQKISLLDHTRRGFADVPVPLMQYRLYSPEIDCVPVLG